jgi:diguanylate cyclase (GGDEF)-like protein
LPGPTFTQDKKGIIMSGFLTSATSYQILIVDDTPANIDILRDTLSTEGYSISAAPNGEEALDIVHRSLPDLVLMDVSMPGLDGYEVCEKIKSNISTRDIPVIFVTAKNSAADIAKGFDVGGVDYITKPIQVKEVISRIKTHLEYSTLLKRNEMLITKLREANNQLDKASKSDPLTGLSNRRDVNAKIEAELVRFKRNKNSFSLILGDIDFFKKINDTYGHNAGDYVLIKISKLMAKAVRDQDVVARWGGEEFLFFLPETDINGGSKLAENIRKKVEAEEFCYDQRTIAVTMSFGVGISKPRLSMEELLKEADDSLYKAKETGRNKVVC